jgi:hypothetical protein
MQNADSKETKALVCPICRTEVDALRRGAGDEVGVCADCYSENVRYLVSKDGYLRLEPTFRFKVEERRTISVLFTDTEAEIALIALDNACASDNESRYMLGARAAIREAVRGS